MNVKLVPVDAYRVDGYLAVGERVVKVATVLCDAYGWVVQAAVRHPRPHRRSPAGFCTRTVHRVDGHRNGDRETAERLLHAECLRHVRVVPVRLE